MPPRSLRPTLFPYTTLFRSDFREGELSRDLVGGDAQRVQPPGHVAGLEDHDIVAELAQLVGTRQPGRSGADDGDTLAGRSEEHTSELQSLRHLVCRLLLEKK